MYDVDLVICQECGSGDEAIQAEQNCSYLRSSKTSKQLGIVLNNIANPIYSDLILGFEDDAIQQGYFVNICAGNRNVDAYSDDFASRGLFIEVLPYKYHID